VAGFDRSGRELVFFFTSRAGSVTFRENRAKRGVVSNSIQMSAALASHEAGATLGENLELACCRIPGRFLDELRRREKAAYTFMGLRRSHHTSPKILLPSGNKGIYIVDTTMRANIQKWGNSLAIRIPRLLAIEAELEENSEVDLAVVQGKLMLTPAAKSYTLDELLAEVSPKNLHSEVSTGAPTGREAW
jgi:antitoxin MazE